MLLAMLMDPTVKPPAEDDIRVINQRKASKQRRAQKWQLVGDEEEPVVRKKPKDPPRPEPLVYQALAMYHTEIICYILSIILFFFAI